MATSDADGHSGGILVLASQGLHLKFDSSILTHTPHVDYNFNKILIPSEAEEPLYFTTSRVDLFHNLMKEGKFLAWELLEVATSCIQTIALSSLDASKVNMGRKKHPFRFFEAWSTRNEYY
ncbi:hypothetical protein VNO77_05118 [Canavalia gladiata]|uniref:Uncharacterized protein n=1 Tax=Canavalia gladiata TaxID=3824 RepID=A0AAN9N4A0_CANGL